MLRNALSGTRLAAWLSGKSGPASRLRRLSNRKIQEHLAEALAASRHAIEIAKTPDREWRDHAPALLNAVASVGALAHEQAKLQRQVAECTTALEAMRRELAEVSSANRRAVDAAKPLEDGLVRRERDGPESGRLAVPDDPQSETTGTVALAIEGKIGRP